MKTRRGTKKLPVVKKMKVEKYPSKEEDKCLMNSGRSGSRKALHNRQTASAFNDSLDCLISR